MWLDLQLLLKSEATFGRGDGVAGLVDAEVEHDEDGLPYLRGRALKGLLVEECANLLFALAAHPEHDNLEQAACWLFGQGGSTLDDGAMMRVGAAMLPESIRRAVHADIRRHTLRPTDVLASLTAIRRQTAVDETTGAPADGSLRSARVVLRGTPFIARLDFAAPPGPMALALLAACVLAFRRAGTGRHRGRGKLAAWLVDETGNDVTGQHFQAFAALVDRGVGTGSAS